MDLGRPIARHFARRPHEGETAGTTTDPDLAAATTPAAHEYEDQPAQAAVEPEPDAPRSGRPGT